MKKYWLAWILLAILCNEAIAQLAHQQDKMVKLTMDNGLPSNHIYGIMKDHLGYLWFGTPKGVARYNGYEFRIFSTKNGLSKNDIWQCFEDSSGKVWLITISNEIGYVLNDKYHKCYLKNINATLYPQNVHTYRNGIIFSTPYLNANGLPTICFSSNDTIYKIEPASNIPIQALISFTDKGKILAFADDKFYECSIANNKIEVVDTLYINNLVHTDHIYNFKMFYVANNLIYQDDHFDGNVYNVNFLTKRRHAIPVHNYGIDSLYRIFAYNNKLFLFSNYRAVEFRVDCDSYKLVADEPFYMSGGEIQKMSAFIKDDLWGYIMGTKLEGIVCANKWLLKAEKVENLDLVDCRYLGQDRLGGTYWWNSETHQMKKTSDATSKYTILFDAKRIQHIFTAEDTMYFFRNNFNSLNLLTKRKFKYNSVNLFNMGVKAMLDKNGTPYGISSAGIFNSVVGKAIVSTIFDADRYIDIIPGLNTKTMLAYTASKILLVDSNGKKQLYNRAYLQKKNINAIERIGLDTANGMYVLKTNSGLFAMDAGLNISPIQTGNLSLSGTSMNLYQNYIILSNSYAVSYIKILGKNHFSHLVTRVNYQFRYFHYINDIQLANNKMLLSTDMGCYDIPFPTDTDFVNVQNIFGKAYLLTSVGGTSKRLKQNDTINIEQKEKRIFFDIVNPIGWGAVAYRTKIDSEEWRELGGNELSLSALRPDRYYHVQLSVQDNIWQSNTYTFVVYISPKWYQTNYAIRLFWTGGILLSLLVIGSAILITRTQVINANRKKNLRMELELKSVYAQINPHFIFNSLNSALLMVSKNKMEDAYAHISKFSKLLRNYIKSSRNLYISLADEIVNLQNYIELQQVRFKDKFHFQVNLDPQIVADQQMIPSLLIQPFVENAINHGLLPRGDKGKLTINFYVGKEKNELICEVVDNGIGRKRARMEKEGKRPNEDSYGDLLVKDLVNIFNSYEKIKIDINYHDIVEPETGTTVNISIKYT